MAADHSRFSSEFETIEVLGSGAFGRVFKCRNTLDMGVYAIKRVARNAVAQNAMREVQMLAKISPHQHVTRYFNAWIENSTVPYREGSDAATQQVDLHGDSLFNRPNRTDEGLGVTPSSSEFSTIVFERDGISCPESLWTSEGETRTQWSSSDATQQQQQRAVQSYACDRCGETYDDWECAKTEWDCLAFSFRANCLCTTCFLGELNKLGIDSKAVPIQAPGTFQRCKELFIQMEYCPNKTLRDWLDHGRFLHWLGIGSLSGWCKALACNGTWS